MIRHEFAGPKLNEDEMCAKSSTLVIPSFLEIIKAFPATVVEQLTLGTVKLNNDWHDLLGKSHLYVNGLHVKGNSIANAKALCTSFPKFSSPRPPPRPPYSFSPPISERPFTCCPDIRETA